MDKGLGENRKVLSGRFKTEIRDYWQSAGKIRGPCRLGRNHYGPNRGEIHFSQSPLLG